MPDARKPDILEKSRDKILFGLAAPDEVVIKSWKRRIIPSGNERGLLQRMSRFPDGGGRKG